MSVQRYPLAWPAGWKRTQPGSRRHGHFNRKETVLDAYGPGNHRQNSKRLSIGDAVSRLFAELERLGVKHVQEDVVISTNLRVNLSGVPRGDQGDPSDPGGAVYWELNGVRQCMAIDQYYRVADNLAAVAASLEAMRTIERHGGAEVLQRAFVGFAALPENTGRPWREVLGFDSDQLLIFEKVERKFREMALAAHPDRMGGSEAAMQELNVARDQARAELTTLAAK
jgi:hypothetical protein